MIALINHHVGCGRAQAVPATDLGTLRSETVTEEEESYIH
jgi:hypothetical protein